MSARALLAVAVAALMLDACGSGSSSPVPSSPEPQVTLTILPPEADAAVVGTPLALHARASLPGESAADATDSVTWSSSDPRIATVDAHGVITAVAPGTMTVTATAKDAKASVSIDVVPNVAGDWSFVAVPTNCDDPYAQHCVNGKPIRTPRYEVRFTQTGHRITGDWPRPGISNLVEGSVEGRVNIDGSLDLRAEHCILTDFSGARRYSLRDWHMDRSTAASWTGRVTWEYAYSPMWWTDCPGEPTGRITEVLAVSDFRR